jgi:hypothetical protein
MHDLHGISPKFHSEDDPFIPMAEASHVAESLGSKFFQYRNRSHFFTADEASCVLESTLKRAKELLEDSDGDDDEEDDDHSDTEHAGDKGDSGGGDVAEKE